MPVPLPTPSPPCPMYLNAPCSKRAPSLGPPAPPALTRVGGVCSTESHPPATTSPENVAIQAYGSPQVPFPLPPAVPCTPPRGHYSTDLFPPSLNTYPSPSDTPQERPPALLAQLMPGQDLATSGLGSLWGVPRGARTPLQPPPAPGDLRVASSTRTPACRMQRSVDRGAVTAPRQGHHPPRPPSGPSPPSHSLSTLPVAPSSPVPIPVFPQYPVLPPTASAFSQCLPSFPVPPDPCSPVAPDSQFPGSSIRWIHSWPRAGRGRGGDTEDLGGTAGSQGAPREMPALLWVGLIQRLVGVWEEPTAEGGSAGVAGQPWLQAVAGACAIYAALAPPPGISVPRSHPGLGGGPRGCRVSHETPVGAGGWSSSWSGRGNSWQPAQQQGDGSEAPGAGLGVAQGQRRVEGMGLFRE